ncbi:MAG: type I-E CRISPR-associated protein Cas5/CasD [Bacillota bacterium]|nr:type I-E CRISPR-associated protein Cas5/CasD [Bacillota bacterium]
MSADKLLLDQFVTALTCPCWITYLGRKCCPATKPLLIGITERFESLEAAMMNIPLEKGSCKNPLCEIEDEKGMVYRQDIISTGNERAYSQRRVSVIPAIADEKGEGNHVSFMP